MAYLWHTFLDWWAAGNTSFSLFVRTGPRWMVYFLVHRNSAKAYFLLAWPGMVFSRVAYPLAYCSVKQAGMHLDFPVFHGSTYCKNYAIPRLFCIKPMSKTKSNLFSWKRIIPVHKRVAKKHRRCALTNLLCHQKLENDGKREFIEPHNWKTL